MEVAPADAKVYRKKTATIKGQDKRNYGPIASKQKGGKSGYIDKEYGFQENT